MSTQLAGDVRAVRSWLDEGRGWLKGAGSCAKGKTCLSTAIGAALPGARSEAVTRAVLDELARRGFSRLIPSWNDASERTWADVDAVLVACAERAEAGK